MLENALCACALAHVRQGALNLNLLTCPTQRRVNSRDVLERQSSPQWQLKDSYPNEVCYGLVVTFYSH